MHFITNKKKNMLYKINFAKYPAISNKVGITDAEREIIREFIKSLYDNNESSYIKKEDRVLFNSGDQPTIARVNTFVAQGHVIIQYMVKQKGVEKFAELAEKFDENAPLQGDLFILNEIKSTMEEIAYEASKRTTEECISKLGNRSFLCGPGTLTNLQNILADLRSINASLETVIGRQKLAYIEALIKEHPYVKRQNFIMEVHFVSSILNLIAGEYNLPTKSSDEDIYLIPQESLPARLGENSTVNQLRDQMCEHINKHINAPGALRNFIMFLINEGFIKPPTFNPDNTQALYGDFEAFADTLGVELSVESFLHYEKGEITGYTRGSTDKLIIHIIYHMYINGYVTMDAETLALLRIKVELSRMSMGAEGEDEGCSRMTKYTIDDAIELISEDPAIKDIIPNTTQRITELAWEYLEINKDLIKFDKSDELGQHPYLSQETPDIFGYMRANSIPLASSTINRVFGSALVTTYRHFNQIARDLSLDNNQRNAALTTLLNKQISNGNYLLLTDCLTKRQYLDVIKEMNLDLVKFTEFTKDLLKGRVMANGSYEPSMYERALCQLIRLQKNSSNSLFVLCIHFGLQAAVRTMIKTTDDKVLLFHPKNSKKEFSPLRVAIKNNQYGVLKVMLDNGLTFRASQDRIMITELMKSGQSEIVISLARSIKEHHKNKALDIVLEVILSYSRSQCYSFDTSDLISRIIDLGADLGSESIIKITSRIIFTSRTITDQVLKQNLISILSVLLPRCEEELHKDLLEATLAANSQDILEILLEIDSPIYRNYNNVLKRSIWNNAHLCIYLLYQKEYIKDNSIFDCNQTPLHIVVKAKKQSMLNYFLIHNRNVINHVDNDGFTALCLATDTHESPEAATQLLLAGADPRICQDQDRSPISNAQRKRDASAPEIAQKWEELITKMGEIAYQKDLEDAQRNALLKHSSPRKQSTHRATSANLTIVESPNKLNSRISGSVDISESPSKRRRLFSEKNESIDRD